MSAQSLASNLEKFLEFYTQQLRWEIFPIKRREKSPPLCKWQMEASRSLEKVLDWWKQYPDANIGLRCGVTSGVVVVDVDPNHTGDESLLELFSKYQNFPDTPLCLSGGGGKHYFFKHPIDVRIPSRNGQLAVGIDIKADGGYVVLPPSIHPSGNRYEWEVSSPPSQVDLPPLPIWLFDLIREEPDKPRDYSRKGSLPLDEDEPFVSGTRNEMLTSLAGSMRRRGMSQQSIFEALKAENIKRCVPPLPDDEVALISESVSRYKPQDVPKSSKMVVSNRRSQLEWLFCASVYYDADLAKKVAGWLEPSCIATDKLRKFWTQVRDGGDKMEVANDLGILSDLTAWTAHISTINEIEALAQQVSRNSYIDNVAENLTQLTQAVSSADVEKTRHIISVMGESVPSIGREVKTAVQGLSEFEDMLKNIDDRAIDTQIKPVDDVLGGLERQTLTIVGARPGSGKTTLAWQIARGVAVNGKRVIFHSLEMSAKALWAKAVAGAFDTVRWRDVRGGKVGDDVLRLLLEEAEKMKKAYGDNLLIDDAPATVDAIWQVTSKYKPELVIVDHLRLLKDFGGGQMREDKRLGYVSQRLKDMAKFFDIPVICLAQLNRSVEGRDDKKPQMSDLRDSGQIEENADNVLMLYPEDYYKLEAESAYQTKELYKTEILFRKIRDDRLGQSCVLYFAASEDLFYSYEAVEGSLKKETYYKKDEF